MKLTQPLRERKQIELLKNYLYHKNRRDHLLFCLGINSALRIGDMLKLTIGDVWDGRTVRDYIELNEQKTGKIKRYPIGQFLGKTIRAYIKECLDDYELHHPLFARQRGRIYPLSRQYASKMLSDAADFCGIDTRLACHGLRKTWAYHAYRQTGNLEMISIALNHSSLRETRLYIGLVQDELDAFYLSIDV